MIRNAFELSRLLVSRKPEGQWGTVWPYKS
jgi:hypothetical protein